VSTRKKIVLGILILVVVILVALVIVVPMLFDVDRYRPQVAALIEQQTGKPAKLGHLALTLVPTLSIRVDDFALKNPAGFPQGDFVKARRIYAVVAAGELWHHQVVIKSLDLDTPAISLLSDLRGNWNFQSKPVSTPSAAEPPADKPLFTLAAASLLPDLQGSWNFQSKPASTPPAADPPGDKPLFTLAAISNLKINKGKLSVANLLPSGQSGPVFFEADGISSELRQVDLNALTESALDVVYAAEPSAKIVAEGRLSIDAVQAMNLVVTHVKTQLRLFPEQVFFDGLDFKCYEGQAVGNLSFAFAGQNPLYHIYVKLDGVDVAKLLDAFPDSRGKMTGKLDGTVKLDGETSHSPDPGAGLRGSGWMTIQEGRLPALKWDENLLQLARLAQMGPASGDPSSFSSIAFDFTIANNRINTSNATIVGNGVDVYASGSLGLAGEGNLDFHGVAKVAASTQNALTSVLSGLSGATVANGKMTFPFILAGTVKNPKFTLKPSGAGSPKGGGRQPPANGLQGLTGPLKKKNE
jgi:uncharacterized protein involved in outer membrane biogenesis